jgi:hypothetical protein
MDDQLELELNASEDDFQIAIDRIKILYDIHMEIYDKRPTKIFVSDTDELQSYIMWAASTFGLTHERTEKIKTYIE